MAPRGPSLLSLDDNCLAHVISKLGLARRTLMLVCKRLKDLAEAACHTHMLQGESVMDAIERAAPGDTVHLLPGAYKEALLLKKVLHLTCDGGQARILSPARFAIMCNAAGCLLEHLVLKSHQIDESVFYLVELGPACHYAHMRHCEVLQGSYMGIQDLKGPNTRMVLEQCTLHVGVSLMAGRLDLTDCVMKCTADSLWAYPGTTLVMRRCEFIDISDAIFIESSTAVVEHCSVWAYDRGPFCVTDTTLAPDGVADQHRTEAINRRLLYLEEAPPQDVWISLPARIKATGQRATPQQREAVLRGELLEGHVVMWGNTAFESRSNEGITAQQEEVRREARQLMLHMQRELDIQEGLDPEDVSIGNSQQHDYGEPDPDLEEDDGWSDLSLSEDDHDHDGDGDLHSDDGDSQFDGSSSGDFSSDFGSSSSDSEGDSGLRAGGAELDAAELAAELGLGAGLIPAWALGGGGAGGGEIIDLLSSGSSSDDSDSSGGSGSSGDEDGSSSSGDGGEGEGDGGSGPGSGSDEGDSSSSGDEEPGPGLGPAPGLQPASSGGTATTSSSDESGDERRR